MRLLAAADRACRSGTYAAMPCNTSNSTGTSCGTLGAQLAAGARASQQQQQPRRRRWRAHLLPVDAEQRQQPLRALIAVLQHHKTVCVSTRGQLLACMHHSVVGRLHAAHLELLQQLPVCGLRGLLLHAAGCGEVPALTLRGRMELAARARHLRQQHDGGARAATKVASGAWRSVQGEGGCSLPTCQARFDAHSPAPWYCRVGCALPQQQKRSSARRWCAATMGLRLVVSTALRVAMMDSHRWGGAVVCAVGCQRVACGWFAPQPCETHQGQEAGLPGGGDSDAGQLIHRLQRPQVLRRHDAAHARSERRLATASVG
jgi:hypothetical protein